MTTTTKGRCQCGAIAYEFEGAPRWVMHCHCENCRRAVSSAVATYLGVRLEQFRYLKGEPTHYESSPGVKRYFCATCGSRHFQRSTGYFDIHDRATAAGNAALPFFGGS